MNMCRRGALVGAGIAFINASLAYHLDVNGVVGCPFGEDPYFQLARASFAFL